MNRLSTHILDTSLGKPAERVSVRLFQGSREIGASVTDADGRCANLLPDGLTLEPGIYRIVFDTSTCFPNGFYPEVAVSFRVSAGVAHYHIPLLLSPFGYTTYRGS